MEHMMVNVEDQTTRLETLKGDKGSLATNTLQEPECLSLIRRVGHNCIQGLG